MCATQEILQRERVKGKENRKKIMHDFSRRASGGEIYEEEEVAEGRE